jgi:hypothetical protein
MSQPVNIMILLQLEKLANEEYIKGLQEFGLLSVSFVRQMCEQNILS